MPRSHNAAVGLSSCGVCRMCCQHALLSFSACLWQLCCTSTELLSKSSECGRVHSKHGCINRMTKVYDVMTQLCFVCVPCKCLCCSCQCMCGLNVCAVRCVSTLDASATSSWLSAPCENFTDANAVSNTMVMKNSVCYMYQIADKPTLFPISSCHAACFVVLSCHMVGQCLQL